MNKIKNNMIVGFVIAIIMLCSGVYASEPVPGIITAPDDSSTVGGSTLISWTDWSDNDTVTYYVTLNNPFTNAVLYQVANNITDINTTFDMHSIPEGNYKLVVNGTNINGLSSTDYIIITNSNYDNLAARDQGLHIWIFVTMLIIIGVLLTLFLKFESGWLAILCGLFMFIFAALIFNGIFYYVCEINTSDVLVCDSKTIGVPFWFNYTLEMILVPFGMLLFVMGVIKELNNFKSKNNIYN